MWFEDSNCFMSLHNSGDKCWLQLYSHSPSPFIRLFYLLYFAALSSYIVLSLASNLSFVFERWSM